jgi:hypothetical protein
MSKSRLDTITVQGTAVATRDIFLNNALLQDGHAARKEAYVLADWER